MSHANLQHLPVEVKTYLLVLRDRLILALGVDQVVHIWVIGSAAYPSGYIAGVSDLDVTVVTRSLLNQSILSRVSELCSHKVLPCPASKLELVIYAYDAVHLDAPNLPYAISLNYNTGRTLPNEIVRYGNHPNDSPHWFILDIAAAHANNRPMMDGEAFSDVFSPKLERRQVLRAILTSICWHSEHEATSSNAVLNACRGWRVALEGVFGSKLQGGSYAVSRLREQKQSDAVRGALEAVKTAIASRSNGALEDATVDDTNALYSLITAEVETILIE